MKVLSSWKLVVVIIISILSNIILHSVFSPIEDANLSLGEPSIFIKKDLLIPALLVWEIVTFSLFTIIFLSIQDRLPGKKTMKGLLYGVSIGGLYFVGMFEATILFNSPVWTEFLMGLPDLISFVLSGILLGTILGTDSVQKWKSQNVFAILIIALFYFFGRYFGYTVLQINSPYDTNPVGTFFWTISLGLWVGIIYFFMQSGSKEKTIFHHSLYFGCVIYGINWLMNHIFLFAIIKFDMDLLIRVGGDILFAIIGIFTYKLINENEVSS